MGMLSGIMEKLGFDRDRRSSRPPPAGSAPPSAQPGGGVQDRSSSQLSAPSQQPQRQPAAVTTVDVLGKLEGLAAANSQKLNWRESIVDLLKLLGMDSSLDARKELARELGCPPDKMGDSAQMNMWLHKALLRQLAENGGNVPKELLH
jgi:hypothetical protein